MWSGDGQEERRPIEVPLRKQDREKTGFAYSSSSISCSTELQHPMSALCFEKTSSFRSSTSLMASSCSSVTLPLYCSISGKTSFSISIFSSVGLSGKFEQLESPWRCKVQRASSSIETAPARRQTLFCPCLASSVEPAKKLILNQES